MKGLNNNLTNASRICYVPCAICSPSSIDIHMSFNCCSFPNYGCCINLRYFNPSANVFIRRLHLATILFTSLVALTILVFTYDLWGNRYNSKRVPRSSLAKEGNTTPGNKVLTRHGLNFDGYFYWISVGALLGTTVCTIHKPSIDIFQSFDELLLMKRGGQIICSGVLGHHSSKLVKYFEDIRDVPKIKENYNPATWMLEVTSASVEAKLCLDFAEIYKPSTQYRINHRDTVELVSRLSEPKPGSRGLNLPTPFAQNSWVQFKACLWKQHLSHWRSPKYNLARFAFIFAASVLFGTIFWQKVKEM
ncbi:hypothetical protein DVH24_041203 [Malus domestica]|uniref:Uncharacterized protein n=1 Tax=Malus domestica TaxID=3750 RepID=A0A498I9D9_MALDO|nr:hypothetical protein DVH24_041203 [Malus domestica]